MYEVTAQINAWSNYLGLPPKVAPESDLGQDQLKYPRLENGYNLWSGTMVFRSLLTSVNALQFMDEHINQTSAVDVVSYAVLSRTAMVGASHAIWLLEDDDSNERLRRGLLMSKENVRQFKGFADKAETYRKTVDPDMEIKAREMRAAGNAEIAVIDKHLDDLGFTPGSRIEDTDLLFQAAKHLDDGSASDWRKPITDAWRISSGFAHALSWQFEVSYNQPPNEFLDEVMAAPFLLTRVAFELFERRVQ